MDKLKPKYMYVHLDDSRDTLSLPDISLHIEPEKKAQNSSIHCIDFKHKKSSSQELF